MFKINDKDTKTNFTHCSGDSIFEFEQVNAGWVIIFSRNCRIVKKTFELSFLILGKVIYEETIIVTSNMVFLSPLFRLTKE